MQGGLRVATCRDGRGRQDEAQCTASLEREQEPWPPDGRRRVRCSSHTERKGAVMPPAPAMAAPHDRAPSWSASAAHPRLRRGARTPPPGPRRGAHQRADRATSRVKRPSTAHRPSGAHRPRWTGSTAGLRPAGWRSELRHGSPWMGAQGLRDAGVGRHHRPHSGRRGGQEVVIRAHDRRPRYRPRKHQDRDEEEQQQRGEGPHGAIIAPALVMRQHGGEHGSLVAIYREHCGPVGGGRRCLWCPRPQGERQRPNARISRRERSTYWSTPWRSWWWAPS